MAGRRWLVGTGAVILALMLMIASFSVGVYVGEHGWTRQGLQYPAGAAAGPPQAGPPLGGGDQPQVTGRIRLVNDRGLELATPDGLRRVDVDAATRVEDDAGASLQLGDLRRGDLVAVFGEFTVGDGGRLVATRIVRLPAPPPARP